MLQVVAGCGGIHYDIDCKADNLRVMLRHFTSARGLRHNPASQPGVAYAMASKLAKSVRHFKATSYVTLSN